VRKALVEGGYVDCIVQLTGQLFANTQIPCSLWFLSKNRDGSGGFRKRQDEILFIDGRKLGSLIPGSRKQKELSEEDVERVAKVYRHFKHVGIPDSQPGFCKVAKKNEVGSHNFTLTAGRFVGSEDLENDDVDFVEKMSQLVDELEKQFDESETLTKIIKTELSNFGYEKI